LILTLIDPEIDPNIACFSRWSGAGVDHAMQVS